MTIARACRPPAQAFCWRLAGRWWIAQYPPSPDFSCGGFVPDEPAVGYDLLTRYYGRFDSPVSARRDLHPTGETQPARDDAVDVAPCRGCVWKHEESGL